MTVFESRGGAEHRGHAGQRLLILPALAIVFATSLLLNARIGTTTDVSWILSIVERMRAGERLYVDIIEVNPPFSMWLYYPASVLADWLSWRAETVVDAMVYATCFAGLGLTLLIGNRAGLFGDRMAWWLPPAILAVFLILPGNVFAQREHIGFVLFLPLLALLAWRIGGTQRDGVPAWLALLAGICGSVLILVKPHWALGALLPAAYLAWSRRSVWAVMTVELIAIGCIALAYLAIVMLLHPAFVLSIVPLLQEVYLPIRNGAGRWLPIVAIFPLTLAIWGTSWFSGSRAVLADVTALAATGFFVAMWSMGKGWDYHLYPAFGAALLASVIALEKSVRDGSLSATARTIRGAFLLGAFALVANSNHDTNTLTDRLIQEVRAHSKEPLVAIVGADIGLGFPFVREVDGRFASPYCSDWAAAYAFLRLTRDADTLSPDQKAWLTGFVSDYVDEKTAELRDNAPDLLVVGPPTAWTRHLMADPDFQDAMAAYKPLVEGPRRAIWRRQPATTESSPGAASG